MLVRARHDVLIIADSDVWVGSDYLQTVTAPLLDHKVGLVTSIYRDVPTKSTWSRLGAMYINEWYMPSVLLAWLFGYEGYVSGQTMCLRRETLQASGGLQAVADYLADDHRLGKLVSGLGLRIVLSAYVVRAEHHEPSWDSLIRHELRWLRTIRALKPRSYCFLFVSFTLPLALLGIVLGAATPPVSMAAWALFLTAFAARLVLHFVPWLRGRRPLMADLWLVPMHDLLMVWIWLRAFFVSRISWRGSEFAVGTGGIMRRIS
jgi:ceramide glucosyltransferase